MPRWSGLAVACALIGSAATAATAGWQLVRNSSLGFSARFPSQPAESNVGPDNAGVRATEFISKSNGILCIVIVSFYPEAPDPQEDLNADRDNFAKTVGATVTSSSSTTVRRGGKALPAMIADFEDSKSVYRTLTVEAGATVYGVAAVVPKNGATDDLDRCVRGFSLI